MPRRKEHLGVALGEHVDCGVYIWTQPSYTVSVYIWTQLTEGNALGVYIWTQPSCSTITPYQLPSQTVLKSALEDPEPLCVLLTVDHHHQQE